MNTGDEKRRQMQELAANYTGPVKKLPPKAPRPETKKKKKKQEVQAGGELV